MTIVPFLVMPNFSKEFVIETYAFCSGVGVVLIRASKPLAFLSKGLSLKFKLKFVYERELMAIVLAVQKW